MNKKTKVLLGSFGAVTLGMIAAGGALAATQTNANGETFIDKVAQVAGIDPQKLKDSIKEVSKSNVEEKLKSGEITQEQANRMNEEIENGNYGFGFGGPRGEKMMFIKGNIEGLAGFLGLTKDDLMQKQQDEMSLLDIAKVQGKTEEELKSFLKQEMTDHLNQALTDGKITQEKVDEMLSNQDEMINEMISRTGFRGPKGDFLKKLD